MEFIEKYYRGDLGGTQIGELRLKYSGRRLDAPDHSFGPAARDNYWLIYIKAGDGFYELENERYRVSAGELFCAFPNKRIFYRADPGSVWSIYWVSVAGESLSRLLALAGIELENPVVRVLDPERTVGIFERILANTDCETLKAKLTVSSELYALLGELTRRERPELGHDIVDDALLYMSNNYIEPMSVAELARRFSVERSYFARLFRARTGLSPVKWLTDFRLKRACELLRESRLHISEVARSVGFSDPLYFSRIFARELGCSPSEYRAAGGK